MLGFQYVVLRAVPRIERDEFINVGVLLYCQETDFLGCAINVHEDKLRVLEPGVSLAAIYEGLAAVSSVCAGEEAAGAAGRVSLLQRFGWLSAPRSTVLQPGPVHGGISADPGLELTRLLGLYTGAH